MATATIVVCRVEEERYNITQDASHKVDFPNMLPTVHVPIVHANLYLWKPGMYSMLLNQGPCCRAFDVCIVDGYLPFWEEGV